MIYRLKAIPDIIAQVYFIGAKSTQIVLLVGFFTGMVLGLQLYFVLVKFGSVGVLGTAIALTLIREMGPVLAAIMITARAGSAMTAEIGIQRISEQVDALSTMRIDLSVYEGEVTTLIGLSGTGKSVTLKHIIGMWSYPF